VSTFADLDMRIEKLTRNDREELKKVEAGKKR
jgi:hypothetical protein